MSSKSRVIQSATITLLVFGQYCCCFSRFRTPTDTFEDTLNNNLLVANEYNSYGHDWETDPHQYIAIRPGVSDPRWSEALRVLHSNAEEQIVHSVTSTLRNWLKDNTDKDDLPILLANEDGEDAGDVFNDNLVGNFNNGEIKTDQQDIEINNIESQPEEDEDIVEYELDEDGEILLNKNKRSGRYYRRYPFKRRNRVYEHPKYNCKPSKEEVVKLLIALHNYQNGNKQRKVVRFCKRDRPLGNIITNIRFLG